MTANTRIEANDIRIERILPYVLNPTGQTLDGLLITIDRMLKDSSPDAMSPSLVNWSSKNLFIDKWVKKTGSGYVSYNEFGNSKIGKGRFEISGNGLFEYDRYIAVSDTRGATGKIYVGATASGAVVTVGVNCYDQNKNLLGTNGGFVCNAVQIANPNLYKFYKSTAFGESNSGTRFLKQNTRFVKLYIEVTSNPEVVFFDESELTTFELDERYLQIFTTNIDWNTAEFFYTELINDTTFTFENDQDGRVRTIFVKNTSSSNINAYFPTALWQGAQALTLVRPGKQSGFTFIKAGGKIYASVIEELE